MYLESILKQALIGLMIFQVSPLNIVPFLVCVRYLSYLSVGDELDVIYALPTRKSYNQFLAIHLLFKTGIGGVPLI